MDIRQILQSRNGSIRCLPPHADSAAQTHDQCKFHGQDLNLATNPPMTQKASNFIGTLETRFSVDAGEMKERFQSEKGYPGSDSRRSA